MNITTTVSYLIFWVGAVFAVAIGVFLAWKQEERGSDSRRTKIISSLFALVFSIVIGIVAVVTGHNVAAVVAVFGAIIISSFLLDIFTVRRREDEVSFALVFVLFMVVMVSSLGFFLTS